jgi:hypothetical protein
MIEQAAALSAEVGVSAACQAYGIPRSSFYAAQQPRQRAASTPPPRALSGAEKAAVRQVLNSERFQRSHSSPQPQHQGSAGHMRPF